MRNEDISAGGAPLIDVVNGHGSLEPESPGKFYAWLVSPRHPSLVDETRPSVLEQLSPIVQALGVLALIGMSVGLALWLRFEDSAVVRGYIVQNALPRTEREHLLGSVFVSALACCSAGLVWVARRGAINGLRLRSIAWRLSPLLIVGLVPTLFDWQLWSGRDLAFLTLAAALTWALRRLVLLAAAEPPLGVFPRLAAALPSLRSLPSERVQRWFALGLPTLVTWLAALGYAVFFAFRTIENHHHLGTSAFDLGLEENLVWNLLHGGPAFKSSPLGPEAIHFGYHATIFSYVLVPFYALYQHAEMLLGIQATLIGAAAVPLYWFARPQIGSWPAALLGLAYVLSPAVQGTNLYDFHYPPLGPVFLWLALYALQARRDVLAAFAILLSLSVREDVAAGVAIIGIYMLFWGRRPRAGVIVALIGTTYFVSMKLIVMPHILGQGAFSWMFDGLLPPGESSFGSVLKTVVGNPTYTWSTLLVEKKLIYVLQILAPLAFLPLVHPMGWVCTLPGVVFTLLTTHYEPTISLGFQYASHWIAYLFPAFAVALAHEQRAQHPFDRLQRARKRSWLVALAFGTLVVSYQYGILFQQNIARAAWDPVRFGMTDVDRERLSSLRAVIALLPPLAKVAGSERVLPHVTNRPDAYALRNGIADAAYLLFDRVGLASNERPLVVNALRDKSFGVVGTEGDFVLAQRGAPPERNAKTLRKVR